MNKKMGLVDIFIIVMFLLTIYFILTRLFGHSATDTTISVSLFTILSGLLYNLNKEFGEFKIKTIHSFNKLKEDINKISKKLKID